MAAARVVRVGVLGVGRGAALAAGADAAGMEVVALCDRQGTPLKEVGARYDVATYTDVERFLEHDMDAVVVATWFHEHAPLAIHALEAGKHVLSETSACMTLAEGCALIDTVERTGLTYMLAENYAFRPAVLELRKRYQAGAIGRFLYAEGNYVHPIPAEQFNVIAPGEAHWRNWLPLIYYCTHALAPIVHITAARPVVVNGFAVPWSDDNSMIRGTARRGDPAGLLVVRTAGGGLVRAMQGTLHGERTGVRVVGTEGVLETVPRDTTKVRVVDLHGERELPVPPGAGGHGGGDFEVVRVFADAVRTGEPPFFDVVRSVTLSVVGVLGHRSALEDSAPVDVPDLTDPDQRAKHATDSWSPDPTVAGPGQPPPSVRGFVEPSAEDLETAHRIWHDLGLDDVP